MILLRVKRALFAVEETFGLVKGGSLQVAASTKRSPAQGGQVLKEHLKGFWTRENMSMGTSRWMQDTAASCLTNVGESSRLPLLCEGSIMLCHVSKKQKALVEHKLAIILELSMCGILKLEGKGLWLLSKQYRSDTLRGMGCTNERMMHGIAIRCALWQEQRPRHDVHLVTLLGQAPDKRLKACPVVPALGRNLQ